jgi:CheY-like chemotaxis protein
VDELSERVALLLGDALAVAPLPDLGAPAPAAACQGLILMVEDDDTIRCSLRVVLEDEGFAVAEAANGKEALAYLDAAPQAPCVILLDLMMPVMNGWEFLRRMRQRRQLDPARPQVPLVVMSAAANLARTPAQPEIAGALPKPFQVDQVRRLLDEHCRRQPAAAP